MDAAFAVGAGTTLRLRRRFEATPERVFAAWTKPDALRSWWCPAGWRPAGIQVDLRPGGTYRFSMIRQCGAPPVTVEGRFLEIDHGRKLVYTWRWDGAFPNMPETKVTVDFREIADGTELALRQEALAIPLCTTHLAGWLAACDRLHKGHCNLPTRSLSVEGASR